MNTTVKKDLPPPPPETAYPVREVSGRGAQAAPHVAVGCLVIAAAAAQVAVNATGDEKAVLTWTMLTAFIVAVVAAFRARRRVFNAKALRRAYYFLVTALGWLATAVLTGLSLGKIGILMAISYSLALYWWQAYPLGVVVEEEKVEELPDFEELWAENVGSAGGPLPGSKLMDHRVIKGGHQFAVKLVPGKQDVGSVRNAVGKIVTGLFLQAGDEPTIENYPGRDLSYARLTILRAAPVLLKDNPWPGPSAYNPRTGKVTLGPYVDGDGGAQWRTYSENSIWGGFVYGAQGTGKTRLVEAIIISLVASTPTVVWFADGRGETGASSKFLRENADYFAGTADQVRAMLRAASDIAEARYDDVIAEDLEGFTPRIDRPGLVVVIDECHKFFEHDDIQKMAAEILRERRITGVTIVAATQATDLNQAFGLGPNADILRAGLLQGNGAVLRAMTNNAKTILNLPYNPFHFPDIPGYARMVKEDRPVAFRSYRLTDKVLNEWGKKLTWLSLPAHEAIEAGEAYADRKNVLIKAKEAALQRREQRRAGVRTATVATESTRAGVSDTPAVVREMLADVAFPAWPGAEVERARPLTEGHSKVLTAMRVGASSPKALMAATELSESRVHQVLSDLMDRGMVRKPPGAKQGVYEIAA